MNINTNNYNVFYRCNDKKRNKFNQRFGNLQLQLDFRSCHRLRYQPKEQF